MQDKKFKTQQKPIKQNKISSVYRVTDQNKHKYFAKIFNQKKLYELNIFQSTQYNSAVLSDLSEQIYPYQFLQIKYMYSTPQGFIFITEQYQNTLEGYLKKKMVDQAQALLIFEQVIKRFWNHNIRPQHFVKVGTLWKMQSLVFSQQSSDSDGLQSQYLWNPAYQPPQSYGKPHHSQQQLTQMMVWNLGSLLLDVLLNSHRLKDLNILKKFKDEPFTFKAIGVKKKFSQNTQYLLSKMLHYNPNKRMKLNQLFLNQYASKTVAAEHKRGIHNKIQRIYMSGQSKLSISLLQNSQRQQKSIKIDQFSKENIKKDEQLKQQLSKITKQKKLKSEKQLIQKLSIITEEEYQSQESSYQTMDDNQLKVAIQTYKNHYDKCQLLIITADKIDKVKSVSINNAIKLLNNYALTFLALIKLHELADNINKNINYLNLQGDLWSGFQSSKQYKGFKQFINFRKNQLRVLLNDFKDQIIKYKSDNISLMQNQQVQIFLKSNYIDCKFNHIKKPYRQIVKSAYVAVTKQYNNRFVQECARLGMYITYCLAYEKLQKNKDIQDNFKHFFQWSKIKNTNQVPLDKFQNYLQSVQPKILVDLSAYIIKKYYDV